ncbi:MAG: CoA pyrophosphatase [Thermoplasmata archaeon]
MSATGSTAPASEPPRDRIRALLERFPTVAPPTPLAGAAVLIVLREGAREIETLLIERSNRPDDLASGQIALPGGHVQAGDRSLAETALRECAEEVGIRPGDLRSVPRFVGIETARAYSMDVAVFAAELGSPAPGPTVYSPEEVASIFWLPRSALDRSERVMRPTTFGAIEVPAVRYADHVLWGFTRRLLLNFFGLPIDSQEEPAVRGAPPGADLSGAHWPG